MNPKNIKNNQLYFFFKSQNHPPGETFKVQKSWKSEPKISHLGTYKGAIFWDRSGGTWYHFKGLLLKVPKFEIFDLSDFHDIYNIKSPQVGDFGVKNQI